MDRAKDESETSAWSTSARLMNCRGVNGDPAGEGVCTVDVRVPSGVDKANDGRDGVKDSGVPGDLVERLASLPLLSVEALIHRSFMPGRSGDSGRIRNKSAKWVFINLI